MMMPGGNRRVMVFLTLAVVLLTVGLVTEFTVLQPRLRHWRSLELQRAQQLQRLGDSTALQRESRVLASYLNVDTLADLDGAAVEPVDPVLYLDHQVTKSGLERIELTSLDAATQGNLRRSRFMLRARGEFVAVIALANLLERDRRLVVIDAFVVERSARDGALEVRVNLSIYDAIRGLPS